MGLPGKGQNWFGNIFQKIEALCQEMDGMMKQENFDNVEKHVEAVHANINRLYSEVFKDKSPTTTDGVNLDFQLDPSTNMAKSSSCASATDVNDNGTRIITEQVQLVSCPDNVYRESSESQSPITDTLESDPHLDPQSIKPMVEESTEPHAPDMLEFDHHLDQQRIKVLAEELKETDITDTLESDPLVTHHFENCLSQELIDPQTYNCTLMSSPEVAESSSLGPMGDTAAAAADTVQNWEVPVTNSPPAPNSAHIEDGQSESSLEQVGSLNKENTTCGESYEWDGEQTSSVEKVSTEAEFLSTHTPAENQRSACKVLNDLPPLYSRHDAGDHIPLDNFADQNEGLISASDPLGSAERTSSAISCEEKVEKVDLDTVVESSRSKLLLAGSFEETVSHYGKVSIVKCVPSSSSLPPTLLSGASAENTPGFSEKMPLAGASANEHVEFHETAEFQDLSFSSDKEDEGKLDESCVAIDFRELYAVSRRVRRLGSLKNKILDALGSRSRTAKEYEKLGLWYGDIHIEDEQSREKRHIISTPAVSTFSDSMSSQENNVFDAEWELL